MRWHTHRHTWQSALRHIGLDWSLMDYLGAAFLQLGPNWVARERDQVAP